MTTFACEERDEIFRDPVAVTNFGIPKRKSDDDWEVNGVGKMQFLSEVGLMVSSESDVLEKSTLNNEGLASAKTPCRAKKKSDKSIDFCTTYTSSFNAPRQSE